MHSNADTALSLDVEQLLSDSVKEILRHEDPQRFLEWFRAKLPRYFTDFQLPLTDPEAVHALATTLGPAIWNATPLPGHGFRTQPLPKPGRNEPCPCGSGRKYKDCCARAPVPPLAQTALWPFVLDRLPASTLQQVIAAHKAPVEALVDLAQGYLEQDAPKKALRLLEPLFADAPRARDEAYAAALYVLCDVYNELGRQQRKQELLQRLVDTLPASPLRSSAKQRLATVHLDAGNPAKAWELFRSAQQESPDDPDIGALEVQLLLGEYRTEQARERAQFWIRRLQRQGTPHDDPMLNFLQAVAKDPLDAMSGVGFAASGGAGERLPDWLEQVRDRPMPRYQATEEPPPAMAAGVDDLQAQFRARLRGMGISEREIARLEKQLKEVESEMPEEPEEAEPAPDTLFLVPPTEIIALEQRWHEVFPLDKPFSIHNEPFGEEDPWDLDTEGSWMEFLEKHPAAFDSLDILDDLATALALHPQAGAAWLDKTMLEPLLLRVQAIVDQALAGVVEPKLAWLFTENRPVLRSLARLVFMHQEQGRQHAALALMERILALNPGDNHGFRSLVINDLLRKGEDVKALALAEQYPGDMHADVAYGHVLALYRLGRMEEAAAALCEATEILPKVVRHLTADRIRKPRIDPTGVKLGGDDQAWLYRAAMRDIWQATPDILPWLEKSAKRCKRKGG